jgi:hypothetical protein
MKLIIFDRKKYSEAMHALELRKAPSYIIEAYQEGYTGVVNAYYKIKLNRLRSKGNIKESVNYNVTEAMPNFVKEARRNKDSDFLKAFFKMTNMDIMSGNKLPPNAAKLIKQGVVKDLGLTDLYKKLK